VSQLPDKLRKKLEKRTRENALRALSEQPKLVDFSSNDYLGLSATSAIFNRASEILKKYRLTQNGATGSRLLTGNLALNGAVEQQIANFHTAEAALIFNSGYDANLGFFSAVPQRGDLIFYDELCHASIRDGIQLSTAKAYKFGHDDMENLTELTTRLSSIAAEVYVVTESVFSMDGDSPNLKSLSELCNRKGFHLVVDEAHAVGIFGSNGGGKVQQLDLEASVFARIVTFGKALGCHGAAILGSRELQQYLVNFARSFIYTTGLPPHSLATIMAAYEYISEEKKNNLDLHSNIAILRLKIKRHQLESIFLKSESAIHCCLIPGNENVKAISNELKRKGYHVLPIMSPTVPAGKERLRVCVHSFNTPEEIGSLIELMAIFVA